MPEIIIVGAGIIGLSTALAICQEATSSYNITLISEHNPDTSSYPPAYTSPWAGAHFRPFPSKDQFELRDYPLARTTLEKFKELAITHPESSIEFVKGVEYFEAPDEKYRTVAEGWKEGVDNFRVLEKNELPSGCEMGVEYDTYILNAPFYLQFLYRMLKFKYDVRFVNSKLKSLKEASKYASGKNGKVIIINCTGQGLQWHGGYDADCFSIRGQTLLINAPKDPNITKATITHQSKDGLWTFYIPRPLNGGIILGGTKQPHDTFEGERIEETEILKLNGARLFPELMKTNEAGEKYFDVVRVNVGFRPARKGGVKIAESHIDGHRVIDGYGCGGSGYEFSWGVARSIVDLLEKPVARL
ncbi:hypothetical protein JCM33374_g6034 [Metschnikowia sp. JCM 33374]|nr:hypothetical protein JCM33374_g6034 [Metschnikowia sp. JCM 33374]